MDLKFLCREEFSMIRTFKIKMLTFVTAGCLVAHQSALGATKTLTGTFLGCRAPDFLPP